jgi:Transposase IS66 family
VIRLRERDLFGLCFGTCHVNPDLPGQACTNRIEKGRRKLDMTITQNIFEAFLQCPTKAYLIAHDSAAQHTSPEPCRVNELYRREGLARLCAELPADQTHFGVLTPEALTQRSHQLICECSLVVGHLETRLQGLRSPHRGKHKHDGGHVPIRFILSEKVSTADKRILAFDAVVFSQVARETPSDVHADETRARIIGKDVYVWVFTSLEEVAFVLSESREASTAQNFLADFKGVLVSDFYTGCDSIDCIQQRCLIHLMRDINEDLCKQPFNEEMKGIARGFADLLRPIIESVDRFGLKARHLRKHRAAAERFYREMFNRTDETDIAVGYQRRFEKAQDRLFTFLERDGIPWNNNNAEHAIKAFARLRNVIGGTSTFKGLREYLILLSISETCKSKGARFLDFLLSQETDVGIDLSAERVGGECLPER